MNDNGHNSRYRERRGPGCRYYIQLREDEEECAGGLASVIDSGKDSSDEEGALPIDGPPKLISREVLLAFAST